MNSDQLKIVFIAPGNSIHTARWANAIALRVEKVTLITLHKPNIELDNKIDIRWLKTMAPMGYFLCAWRVSKILDEISPDMVHAHYGTGYGLLARLSKKTPLLLSLWGSDIFEFPNRSRWHKNLLQKNLLAANHIAVTSHIMRNSVKRMLPNECVSVTPFGIDTNLFSRSSSFSSEVQTIGTVKALENKYGIDTLIRAFGRARQIGLSPSVKLRIVGSGRIREQLLSLVKSLGIDSCVNFIPHVAHANVPDELNKLDVYLALSNEESFGVAPLEASSCSLPVIASNVGGLPEVVEEGKTGYLVATGDYESAAKKIVELANQFELRKRLGENGRRFVVENYSWDSSVEKMVNIYEKLSNNLL